MTANQIIFYLISVFILGAGLIAVTARKVFRSAIWLLFSLIGIAGFYFWIQVEFVAAVQIIVYVGGIVVLIIFSIFLTQQSGKEMPKPITGRTAFSSLAVISGFVLTYLLIFQHTFNQTANKSIEGSVANIGTQLLSISEHGYVLPFEVVSILLLAAMIGCIVIAIKARPEIK
ncbi:MAG TPA: NADH-quinone oxidoreductase subunit J [Bacteroidia bacterium]|nr:NADH-quinone oxidoreductase subunit J [Bacteroidia bacterium]